MKSARWLMAFIGCVGALSARAQPAGVAFEQRLGAQLPLDTVFEDASGRRHHLADYFDRLPVVVYFGYANCPQLCSVVADGTVAALRQIRPEAGADYRVLAISIDPDEKADGAARRRGDALRRYGRGPRADGWTFLTGSADAIAQVTDRAGFRYRYDPATRQFAHASGFLVATPDGRISRYFAGVDFEPRAVARAIAAARAGETGEPVSPLLLLCFRGDSIGGRYGPLIWRVLGAGVALTVAGLGLGVGRMLRHERRRRGGRGLPP
ncbi:MAG TPA: SCO family protein [Lacunisphaera sp.]|nr:SCO family protein [Lacunisphaera sp.]